MKRRKDAWVQGERSRYCVYHGFHKASIEITFEVVESKLRMESVACVGMGCAGHTMYPGIGRVGVAERGMWHSRVGVGSAACACCGIRVGDQALP